MQYPLNCATNWNGLLYGKYPKLFQGPLKSHLKFLGESLLFQKNRPWESNLKNYLSVFCLYSNCVIFCSVLFLFLMRKRAMCFFFLLHFCPNLSVKKYYICLSKNCWAWCSFLFLILSIEKQQCAIFLSIEEEDTHKHNYIGRGHILFDISFATDSNICDSTSPNEADVGNSHFELWKQMWSKVRICQILIWWLKMSLGSYLTLLDHCLKSLHNTVKHMNLPTVV